jgi:hypothetical protein
MIESTAPLLMSIMSRGLSGPQLTKAETRLLKQWMTVLIIFGNGNKRRTTKLDHGSYVTSSKILRIES